MKILFDTNVILDVLLNRELFIKEASKIVSTVESREIDGYLCATTLTTIDYLVTKLHDRQRAKIEVKKLLNLFEICEVNAKVLEWSLESKFQDFEDGVLCFSGEYAKVDGIVTRNTKDFKAASLPVYSPTELWSAILLRRAS